MHYLRGAVSRAVKWLSTENRYLGLQFVIKGEVHYGWARLNVGFTSKGRITATLTGYAYETVPNKPILTGKTKGPDVVTLEPATLGPLAQGASQIQAWRGQNKYVSADSTVGCFSQPGNEFRCDLDNTRIRTFSNTASRPLPTPPFSPALAVPDNSQASSLNPQATRRGWQIVG